MRGVNPIPAVTPETRDIDRMRYIEERLNQLERAHPQTRIMVTLTPVDPAPDGTMRLGDNGAKRAVSWRISGTWRYVLLA